MGCLSWLVGGIVWAVIYSLTDNGIAAFLGGLGGLGIAYLILHIANQSKQRRTTQNRSQGQPLPGTVRKPYEPRRKPVKFKDLKAATEGSSTGQNDLKDINDAFTGEPLRVDLGVYQCTNCKVYYHESSFDFLRSENNGRCVSCFNINIVSLRKLGTIERGRSYSAEIVTLANYRNYVGHVVTFEGYVTKIHTSRDGRHYAVMFENKSWTKGFKMVVFAPYLRAVGGETFLRNLTGKTVRVRGLLQQNHVFGYQIILNTRQMILEVK